MVGSIENISVKSSGFLQWNCNDVEAVPKRGEDGFLTEAEFGAWPAIAFTFLKVYAGRANIVCDCHSSDVLMCCTGITLLKFHNRRTFGQDSSNHVIQVLAYRNVSRGGNHIVPSIFSTKFSKRIQFIFI